MEEKNSKRSKLLMVLGFMLLPIFFCTFIIDRFIMTFVVMGNAPDIVAYFQDMKYIGISVLRTFVVSLVLFVIWWIWK